MRSTASGAHGDRSDTLTPSSTRRSCARPTTSICRRSLRSIPISGRMNDCLRATAHWRRQARSPRSIRRGASSSTTRCAISGCRAPNCRPTRRRASRRSTKNSPRCPRATRTTCSTPPTRGNSSSTMRPALAGVPADVLAAARAGRRRRRQARLEAVAAHAVLSAGHAVCRESQLARNAVSRIRHASKRIRQTRMGQQQDHRTRARAATRSRRTARLRELCGSVARAEDGTHARRKCSPSCATSPSKAKPFAERDMAELKQFARDELGLPDLAAWDLPYVSEKLREARYSFSDQEVKQYFPEDRVLAGMFRVVETIFGVTIRESKARGMAPHRALLRRRRSRRRGQSASSTSTCTRGPASAAARGWTTPSIAAARRRAHTASRRLPDLQFLGAGRRQAGAVHARRSDDAVPRVRPRAALCCSRASTFPACPASRASNGTRSSCPASSWKISAGSGTCSST